MTTLTPDDALPGLDDLDVTLHEPVTKENDMNEARASERADLVELRRLMEAATQLPYEQGDINDAQLHVYCDDELGSCVFEHSSPQSMMPRQQRIANLAYATAACNALPGLIAEVEQLRAELSRASERADLTTERILEIAVQSQNETLAEFPGSAQSQTVDELRDDPPLARMIEKFARHIEAELSRASATAQEPAATASRTVSEQELHDEFTELLHKLSVELYEGGKRGDSGAGYETTEALRQFVLRLIPAPSVAEPATRASAPDGGQTCGGSGTLEEFKGGECILNMPCFGCPDCTPASAEQKCSNCPIHCISGALVFGEFDKVTATCPCACHAAAEDKP